VDFELDIELCFVYH